MFFVLNKEKMKSYLISLSTVVILLMLSVMLQNNISNKVINTSGTLTKTPICSVETTEKEVALSINCVENMNNLDNILDTLSKMNSKATFFVTGDIVDKYPNEVKKIINNGNEIGNLGDKYKSFKQMSKDEIRTQMQNCNKKVEGATSTIPKLFRVPYGEYTNAIMNEAENNNMKVVGWNIDSLDYNELTEDEIWERIDENLANGSIILMHNEYMNNNLENILHNIQGENYKIVRVSDLIK